ncbi:MAG: hypothetical protein WC302_00730 [Candidatus Paceibacterota bacterium]|jgi:hypothetical protein
MAKNSVEIKKDSFLPIVNVIKSGLSERGLVEQFSHFTFTGTHIVSFNDKVSLLYPFEIPFSFSIKGDIFISVLNKIKGDVSMELKGNQVFLVSESKEAKEKSESGLNITKDISSITDRVEIPNSKKWKALPEGFFEGVKLCSFNVSADVTHPYLNCLCIGGGEIRSSDNIRISRYSLPEDIKPMMIQRSSLSTLVGLGLDLVSYQISGAWYHFLSKDGIVFSCKGIDEKFPDVSPYFEFEGSLFDVPEELKEIIEDVSILCEGDFEIDRVVDVQILKKEIICSGKGSQGFFTKTIPYQAQKFWKDLKFSVSAKFFSQVLLHKVKMGVDENKLIFNADQFSHVMSLQA